MLDNELASQLREVFGRLTNPVHLNVQYASGDPTGLESLEMAKDLAQLSPLIVAEVRESAAALASHALPHLAISGTWINTVGKSEISKTRDSNQIRIRFSGTPGGHEFTSMVLAILLADGKGKLPDDVIQAQIRNLKGPLRLKTFISLSCEVCPEVVQTINQFAAIHEDFEHDIIDGAIAESEVQRLGIQAVPSVFVGDELIHVGKIGLLELIELLKKRFGVTDAIPSVPVGAESVLSLGKFDVAVIGAGPAGSSAAIYTSRKGLSTALLGDRFGGQVKDTRGIENLISVPYTEGPQLVADLEKHVASYPIKMLEHRKVKNVVPGQWHKILMESGEQLEARALIVASGAKWKEMNVPGEKEYLGRGVAFCPHCDGPFYKGKKVAVIGGGNSGVEAAIDLAGIVREVVLIEFSDQLKADHVLVSKLKSLANVSILTGARTTEIRGDGAKVNSLVYEVRATRETTTLDVDGVFVQIGLIPNTQFLKGIVDLTGAGEIPIDTKCRTSVKGIYAAGDVTTVPYKQIVIAIGEGAKAALAAFEDQML